MKWYLIEKISSWFFAETKMKINFYKQHWKEFQVTVRFEIVINNEVVTFFHFLVLRKLEWLCNFIKDKKIVEKVIYIPQKFISNKHTIRIHVQQKYIYLMHKKVAVPIEASSWIHL